MRIASWLTLAALSLLTLSPARADYMPPDLIKVPIGRVITNLEAQLTERPDDVGTVHALARAHAMAYALALSSESMVTADEGGDLWFGGPDAPRVPFEEPQVPADQAARDAAARHLEQALELYGRALKLRPDDVVIRLGHAWCLVQAGQRDEAKARLRGIVASAWTVEQGTTGTLAEFVTVEAGRSLVNLLDPVNDKDEIADVEEKIATLKSARRPVTPLVIPQRDGADLGDLVDPRASVRFDLDGSGRPLAWQWITREAGWLVFDPRGSGRVDSALQLFGERTFGLFLADAYAALSLLDDDRDGWVRGAELAGLAVWQDTNQDGVSQPGEVLPVAAWGVTGLACRGEAHPSGIRWNPAGIELAGGRSRPSFDVILAPR